MSIYSWTVILSKKKILLDSKRDIKNFSAYFSIDKTLDELQSQIPSHPTFLIKVCTVNKSLNFTGR
jgi:biopolymer transport protein TolQ